VSCWGDTAPLIIDNRGMKRTVNLDDDLVQAVEDAAAREQSTADAVVADAVRGRFAAEGALRRTWDRQRQEDPGEDAATALAYSELRNARQDRRGRAVS
jgi:predicted transcriptional regulator